MRAFNDRIQNRGASADPAKRGAWLEPVKLDVECCLTSRDYTLLEGLLVGLTEGRAPADPLLVRLVRTKLANARVVLAADVAPDIATGNSRISFSIDGEAPTTRVLAHWEEGHEATEVLTVRTLLGATLLGMNVGQQAVLLRGDRPAGCVALHDVLFQPEAARRHRLEVEVSHGR